MSTVVFEVRSLDDALNGFASAWNEPADASEQRISFATPELLWKVLTAKRWDILKSMAGCGAMSIREVSRKVERDVKGVHKDIHALLDVGVLRHNDSGQVEFPYDRVHVDFTLDAAA